MTVLETRLPTLQARVETALARYLPDAHSSPHRLHEAMRYAALDGGKRVRPVLVYAAGEALGAPDAALDAAACAVECVHVYSLVHDDLPAMDDDDLRRGKPTVHKAYDEATAILVGDALQALAFEALVQAPVRAEQRVAMMHTLAQASGSLGMAGGQAIDLAAVGQALTLDALEDMHLRKTGALIRASVRLGALCAAEVNDDQLARLDRYARNIGLAFQIRDDVLDVEGDTATLGKTQGADQARGKPTYPALLGLDGAKAHARALHEEALTCLEPFGTEADLLRAVARYIVERMS
ncbi:(2E,6E)-farnesyl diphosphate synthase [Ectothiorhodospiraceae bacterium 2226]|nr:(2E,6E)-farnesyl diphosphate synthase [Ectothiorhodospiraceae bacterium 2226]